MRKKKCNSLAISWFYSDRQHLEFKLHVVGQNNLALSYRDNTDYFSDLFPILQVHFLLNPWGDPNTGLSGWTDRPQKKSDLWWRGRDKRSSETNVVVTQLWWHDPGFDWWQCVPAMCDYAIVWRWPPGEWASPLKVG